jgi:hypothetical protein
VNGDPGASLALHIDFAEGGNGGEVRRLGWGGQEEHSVWSTGAASTLRLPPPAWSGPLTLEIDVDPCLAPPVAQGQLLALRVNGVQAGWQVIGGPSRVRCHIPAALLHDGAPIDIELHHPGFLRPDWFGRAGEDRLLGVRVFRLTLAPAGGESAPPGDGFAMLTLRDPPAAPAASPGPIATIGFGPGQPGAAGLGPFWHTDADGLVWSAGRLCHLDLPLPPEPGPIALRIALAVLTVQDLLPSQRVCILADGVVLGQFRLRGETVLCLAVPRELTEGRAQIRLSFHLPDAIAMRAFAGADPQHAYALTLDWIALERPPARLHAALALRGDDMEDRPPLAASARFLDLGAEELRAAVLAETGIKPAELMRGFESLGDNCAFGLAQRKAGAEILGLLRFANTKLRALLTGLADSFKAATVAGDIDLTLHSEGNPREYMLGIKRYGIRWHTLVHENEAEAETVDREQKIKLGFLRRKFMEGLRSGRKIYSLVRSEPRKVAVVMPGFAAPRVGTGHRGLIPMWDPPLSYEVPPPPLSVAEAQTVLLELNRAGPNTLLYFVPCTRGRASGTVELLAPGLMRGYMSSFVITPTGEDPNDLDWVRVAANAWLLNRDARDAFREQGA